MQIYGIVITIVMFMATAGTLYAAYRIGKKKFQGDN